RGATPDSKAIRALGMWPSERDERSIYETFAELFNDPAFIEQENERMKAVHVRHRDWFRKMQARKDAASPEKYWGHVTPRDFYESNLPLMLVHERTLALWELLVERGVDPNWTNGIGESPLHHVASWNGSAATAELLLKHGGNPNLPRADGKTPYVLAVQSGNAGVAATLLAHGADPDSVQPV